MLDRLDSRGRKRVSIYFQSQCQCVAWAQSIDRFMELELIAPKRLVAKSVKTKYLLSRVEHLPRIVFGIAEKCKPGILIAILRHPDQHSTRGDKC